MRMVVALVMLLQVVIGPAMPNRSSEVRLLVLTKYPTYITGEYIVKLDLLKRVCMDLNRIDNNQWGLWLHTERTALPVSAEALIWKPTMTGVAISGDGEITWRELGRVPDDVSEWMDCTAFQLGQYRER